MRLWKTGNEIDGIPSISIAGPTRQYIVNQNSFDAHRECVLLQAQNDKQAKPKIYESGAFCHGKRNYDTKH